jgi:hypothetical protein
MKTKLMLLPALLLLLGTSCKKSQETGALLSANNKAVVNSGQVLTRPSCNVAGTLV